jgi:hypothetical protein
VSATTSFFENTKDDENDDEDDATDVTDDDGLSFYDLETNSFDESLI